MIPPTRKLMLAPNQQVLFDSPFIEYTDEVWKTISGGMYSSRKLDGMRCLVYGGNFFSRALKPLKLGFRLHRFPELSKISQKEDLVFDGELFSEKLSFSQLMSVLRNQQTHIPDHVQLHVIDMLTLEEYQGTAFRHYGFATRYVRMTGVMGLALQTTGVVPVQQYPMHRAEDAERHFNDVTSLGGEGTILRSGNGRYKHGRATLNEGTLFKFKKWHTEDARIIGFEQGTSMTKAYANSQRGKNEDGSKARTSAKETRELVDTIGSIKVQLKNGVCCNVGQARGKKDMFMEVGLVWKNRYSVLNKWVEIEYMEHGVKDKPRFGRIVRFRPDLDT